MMHRFRYFMMPEDALGAGASPAPAAPATPIAPAAPAPGPSAPAVLPLSSVEAFAAAVNDKLFASLRTAGVLDLARANKGGAPAATPSAPPAAPPPTTPATTGDLTELLALRDRFDDATGDLPLKATQKSLLREQVMRDRPADVSAYVSIFAERAGWNLAAPTAPPQPGPAAPSIPLATNPGTPPVTGRPVPPVPLALTDSTPILSMTPSDQEAHRKAIGIEKFVDKLHAELATTRVRP